MHAYFWKVYQTVKVFFSPEFVAFWSASYKYFNLMVLFGVHHCTEYVAVHYCTVYVAVHCCQVTLHAKMAIPDFQRYPQKLCLTKYESDMYV